LREHEKTCQTSLKESEEQLRALEAQQASAIEKEEYDQADQLNEVIEKTKRKISGTLTSIKSSGERFAEHEQRRSAAIAAALRVVKECTEHFAQLQQLQEKEMQLHVQKQTTKLNDREDQLNAQFDRVERTLAHVAADLKQVEVEEVRVTLSLSGSYHS
jgi:hypothetical protein